LLHRVSSFTGVLVSSSADAAWTRSVALNGFCDDRGVAFSDKVFLFNLRAMRRLAWRAVL
jgi:hypothetical protein